MPNATVRANARSLPETTDRRAVLRGMMTAGFAAGASSALTTVAAATGVVLIERCRIADESLNAASGAKDDILWAQVGPTRMHAAETWSEADARLWPDIIPGEAAHPNDVQRLRACLAVPGLWGGMGFPPEAFAERAREIVAIRDHFTAKLERAKANPEVMAADAETTARFNEWHSAALQLAKTRARTVDGMIAKLVMVATWGCYDEDEPNGTYDGILVSAALDAVALNGRPA
jgi:hypothetical protein